MNYSDITALIADDEAHMRTFIKLLLADIGITKLYQMQNGMDAVEAYSEYKPDLVLLDINMNKMNGLEALGRIRAIDDHAVVIMMTAVATRDAVEDSSRKGATYYVLKTQPADQIKALIKEVIDAHVVAKPPQP